MNLIGTRPGVDGFYHIESARHVYSRAGYVTYLTVSPRMNEAIPASWTVEQIEQALEGTNSVGAAYEQPPAATPSVAAPTPDQLQQIIGGVTYLPPSLAPQQGDKAAIFVSVRLPIVCLLGACRAMIQRGQTPGSVWPFFAYVGWPLSSSRADQSAVSGTTPTARGMDSFVSGEQKRAIDRAREGRGLS